MSNTDVILLVLFLTIFFVVFICILIAVISKQSGNGEDKETRTDKDDYVHIPPDREQVYLPPEEEAGMIGETIANYELKALLKNDEYLLTNLLLPLENGHKTEIDCVLISHRGIFCIEVKKWDGRIYGNDEDEYWIQKCDDFRGEREHRSPVIQNEGHCAILKRKLNNKFGVENIVLFVKLESLSEIESDYVFTIRQFKEYYNDLNDNAVPTVDLLSISNMLKPYVATKEELEQHKKEVQERFKN